MEQICPDCLHTFIPRSIERLFVVCPECLHRFFFVEQQGVQASIKADSESVFEGDSFISEINDFGNQLDITRL